MVKVINLATGKEITYVGLTPRIALLSAHAQSKSDFQFTNYEQKYGKQVRESPLCLNLGDFAVFKDQKIYSRTYRVEYLEHIGYFEESSAV